MMAMNVKQCSVILKYIFSNCDRSPKKDVSKTKEETALEKLVSKLIFMVLKERFTKITLVTGIM